VIARRAVFADPRVTTLLARFVCAADEVGRLQRGKDPEGLLFQKVAEQGHYAGRTVPTSTRQGLYATTAGGTLLASINHNDPARVAAMLEQALAAWDKLPAEQRAPADGWDGTSGRQRLEARYPEGGLALRVLSRDLPREEGQAAARAGDWRAKAWNLDYAWFRREEARALLPPGELVAGTQHEVPRALVDRLVRLHLLDNVRGQTYPAKPEALEKARLTAHVSGTGSFGVFVHFEGEARWSESGSWRVAGLGEPVEARRGVEVRITGGAHWDPKTARFDRFDLLAHGTRWGATQYNARHDDLGPAPIAWLFELAPDTPSSRVAPASIWHYGW
jgi:hypothetical protein